MPAVDIALVVIGISCFIAGLFWGAVRIVSVVLACVAAVLAGRWAGPPLVLLLASGAQPSITLRIVAVAGVAVVAAGLVLVAGRGLRKGLEALRLTWLDRLAGGILSTAVAFLATAFLLGLAAAGGHPPGSPLARELAAFGQTILSLQTRPNSRAMPSTTPPRPTSKGQQPERSGRERSSSSSSIVRSLATSASNRSSTPAA
jgi:uncharacterized membrane protein required for colicin V production